MGSPLTLLELSHARVGFILMKTQNIRKIGLLLAVGMLALGAWMAQAANDPGYGPVSPLPSSVADVLKLNQAKINDNTIIAYVQNSGITYHLDASQIISLRDQGLSDGVITAMLSGPTTTPGMPNAQPNDQTPDMNPPPPPQVNSTGDTTSGSQPTVIYVNSTPVYYYPAWSYSWWWPVGVTWGWAWWGGCWHWGCHGGSGFRTCGFWNHGFHGSSGFHTGFNHGFNQGFNHGFNNAHGFNTGFHSAGSFQSGNGFHGNMNVQGANSFRGMSSSSAAHFGGMNNGGFHGFNGSGMGGFHGMSGGGGMHFGGGGMMGGGHGGGGGGGHGGR